VLSEECHRRLDRAYSGEVFGVAFFEGLADRRVDASERETLLALASLERRMRDALIRLYARECIEPPIDTSARERAEEAVGALSAEPWATFLGTFAEGTARALVGYSRLRAAAPDADEPILVALTRHEEALEQFALASAAGDTMTALIPVRAVIAELDSLASSSSGR
jgi:hypothetical protein